MATLQPYKKYNAIVYDYATHLPNGWKSIQLQSICYASKIKQK
jgi:hypothetical protein